MIADELGLPVSTVYRYLRTLREFGLAFAVEGIWSATASLDFVRSGISRSQLVALAAPVLQQLSATTQETAALTIRAGLHAVCIHQVESPQPIRMAFRIGQILPLYAGAAERVLLAHAPADVVDAVVSGETEPLTSNTPNREELVQKLASIRRSGYGVSSGEVTPGAIEVAAPVRVDGEAVCALSVTAPEVRCKASWPRSVRATLLPATRRLGEIVSSTRAQSAPRTSQT